MTVSSSKKSGPCSPSIATSAIPPRNPSSKADWRALDSKTRALQGGDTGPAIVPSKPEASMLLTAIRYADPDLEMPPKEKLPDEVIANFEKWIKAGAPFPEGAVETAELKPWWELIAAEKLRARDQPASEVVDHYVTAILRNAKVQPVSAASDANFIRRVTLDLAGRIPTPGEVRAYESSANSDKKQQLAFSPDGKMLAAGGIDQVGNVDGLSAKARVDLFRWEQKESVGTLKMEKNGMIEFLAFHPKGDWLLATGGGDKGVIAFIDPAEKKVLSENEASMFIHKIVLEDDGQKMFAAGHKRFAIFAATQESTPSK